MLGPLLRSLILTYGVKYAKNFVVATVKALEKSGYQPKKVVLDMLNQAALPRNPMSKDEATKILNLKNNASALEIENTYTKMFNNNFPSNGGSFYLQCKLKGAKDVLVNKNK